MLKLRQSRVNQDDRSHYRVNELRVKWADSLNDDDANNICLDYSHHLLSDYYVPDTPHKVLDVCHLTYLHKQTCGKL